MPFPTGLSSHAKQRFGADLAAERAQQEGLAVETAALHDRTWLRLNGNLSAVFSYAAGQNEPRTYRFDYLKHLAEAVLVVFVDCSGPDPQFLVVPAKVYADDEVDWDAALWHDRWDLAST